LFFLLSAEFGFISGFFSDFGAGILEISLKNVNKIVTMQALTTARQSIADISMVAGIKEIAVNDACFIHFQAAFLKKIMQYPYKKSPRRGKAKRS
jgi:hypothetical protein